MQTCNFTPNRQLRKSDAVCASAPINQACIISPRLNSLKIDPEQSLSPKSDGRSCAISDSKQTAQSPKRIPSGKRRLAFLVLAAALNGCVPDSILLSERDASAEVSQVDATDEDSEITDVKKPRDASLDEEEVDASLDATEEDASIMDADATSEDVSEDRMVADVSEEETTAPDRVPPRDSPDADVEDVVSEDVPTDRVAPPSDVLDVLDAPEDRAVPPRDSPDADVEDVVSEDVPTDRVVPPMDTPRDIPSESSVSDVVSESSADVPDATRYCPLTSFSSYMDLNALQIISCTPNSDGSSNSACPNAPRTFAGLGLFATDTNGSRTAFDVSIYCMEGGRATMRLGGVLLRTSETTTFCISTAPDRGVSYTISGVRHLTSPPGRDGLGAIDGQIRAVDSTAPTCRTSVP